MNTKRFVTILSVLTFLSVNLLAMTPSVQAQDAEEDANDVYEWTGSFDGGDGSTINTSPDEEDGEADYSL